MVSSLLKIHYMVWQDHYNVENTAISAMGGLSVIELLQLLVTFSVLETI